MLTLSAIYHRISQPILWTALGAALCFFSPLGVFIASFLLVRYAAVWIYMQWTRSDLSLYACVVLDASSEIHTNERVMFPHDMNCLLICAASNLTYMDRDGRQRS